MGKKCVVLLSGGLDSLLAVKIMKEQKFEVFSLFFKLPFMKDVENDVNCFVKKEKIKLKIFDCTKGNLLKEYLKVICKPKYGRGGGVNPCIDCRIFIFRKAKEFADKNEIELVVSGEVLGERPMSQMQKTMNFIEEESSLKNNLLRPLSAKLLQETNSEKKGVVDRKKLFAIQGRRRVEQFKLAKKFKINYPSPSGGCILCERGLKKRFEYLLKRGLDKDEVKLVGIGRHFLIDNCWVVLGRNEEENKFIESFKKAIVSDTPGPSAIILGKYDDKIKKKVNELIRVYSKSGSLEKRKRFERYIL